MPRSRFQCYLAEDQQARWRFMVGNHAVAESPSASDSVESVFAQARRVRDHAAELRADLVSVKGARWWWTAFLDDETVAVCSHAYGRRAECLAAVERFRTAATHAEVQEEVLDFSRLRSRRSGRSR